MGQLVGHGWSSGTQKILTLSSMAAGAWVSLATTPSPPEPFPLTLDAEIPIAAQQDVVQFVVLTSEDMGHYEWSRLTVSIPGSDVWAAPVSREDPNAPSPSASFVPFDLAEESDVAEIDCAAYYCDEVQAGGRVIQREEAWTLVVHVTLVATGSELGPPDYTHIEVVPE